jgi:hypothetical protein
MIYHVFAECKEYAQFVYEKQTVHSPVIGEPNIEKLVSKCKHEVVPLIVGKFSNKSVIIN